MHETYRMLGRAHEADLEREAAKWRLGDQAREQRDASGLRRKITQEQKAGKLLRALIAPLRARRAHADT